MAKKCRRTNAPDEELLPEYDFAGAVRGKYFDRYWAGRGVVRLEPDVAECFPDSAAVNRALRGLMALAPRVPARAVPGPADRGARRR